MDAHLTYPADWGLRAPRIGTRRMGGALLVGVALWSLVRVGDSDRSWFDEILAPGAALAAGLWLVSGR